MIDDAELLSKAEAYAKSRGMSIICEDMLGYGSDGNVWRTSGDTAVKAMNQEKNYRNELECYRRLKADNVSQLGLFSVPVLEGFDDSLRVIEMTIVEPPYLLDFGKVYLDSPPNYLYDSDLMARTMEEWRDRFGVRWNKVAGVIQWLTKYDIYYYDPRPGNISFGDEDDFDD